MIKIALLAQAKWQSYLLLCLWAGSAKGGRNGEKDEDKSKFSKTEKTFFQVCMKIRHHIYEILFSSGCLISN